MERRVFRQRGHDQEEPTSVYVLECAGRVKIGIAADVAVRVEHLQLACPLEITVAHERRFPTRTQARLAERSVHVAHAASRLWGEWFELDVATAIASVQAAEEREPPVRIPSGRRAPAPLPRKPKAVSTKRRAPPLDGKAEPTWEELEAMSDDEWVEHMRPLAAVLDFA
jgi:hypothetical protein